MEITTKCKRCGRTLTAAASIARGYGRTCAAKRNRIATVLSTYQEHQITRALELIELGAVVPAGRTSFDAVSSDGTTTYHVDAAARRCTCPAGQHGRICYHLAAVDLLAAA